MSTYQLLFLGTCACDYSPRLATDCKDRFDRDARRASSLLLNGRLLIDCGPHCLDAMCIAEVDAGEVTDLLLTHLHSDHFNPDNVRTLADACRKKKREAVERMDIRDGDTARSWERERSTDEKIRTLCGHGQAFRDGRGCQSRCRFLSTAFCV